MPENNRSAASSVILIATARRARWGGRTGRALAARVGVHALRGPAVTAPNVAAARPLPSRGHTRGLRQPPARDQRGGFN